MKKRHTENIDEIEEFYKKEFENTSFEIDEAAFDSIHRSVDSTTKISTLKKYLKISVSINILFLLLSIPVFYQLSSYNLTEEKNKPSDPTINLNPVLNKENVKDNPKALKEKEESGVDLSNKKIIGNRAVKTNLEKNKVSPIFNNSSVSADTTAATLSQEKIMNQEEAHAGTVKKENNVENKELDFYKKHSSALKEDSSRKLFVPDK